MKSRGWLVVGLLLGAAQTAAGQSICSCGPVVLQPASETVPSPYYAVGPAVASGPASPPVTTVSPVSFVGPTVPAAPNIVYRPLLPVSPSSPPYYVGQGLLGQPKVYMPGQPVRNFLRYLSF